jgi:hypothetical protein
MAGIFQRELSSLFSTTARDVDFRFEAGPAVDGLEVYGLIPVSVRKELDCEESVVILYRPSVGKDGGGRCGRMRTGVFTSAEGLGIRAI